MASELIGRMACPECDFHAAHIKIKTDKEGAQPYRHCPECGAQYFARNKQQGDNLRRRMRSEGSPAPANPSAEGGTAAAAVAQTTPPPAPREQKYTTVFGVRVPVED